MNEFSETKLIFYASICTLFSEPNYRYIVELLHVPLQTIYNCHESDVSTNGDVQN